MTLHSTLVRAGAMVLVMAMAACAPPVQDVSSRGHLNMLAAIDVPPLAWDDETQ